MSIFAMETFVQKCLSSFNPIFKSKVFRDAFLSSLAALIIVKCEGIRNSLAIVNLA